MGSGMLVFICSTVFNLSSSYRNLPLSITKIKVPPQSVSYNPFSKEHKFKTIIKSFKQSHLKCLVCGRKKTQICRFFILCSIFLFFSTFCSPLNKCPDLVNCSHSFSSTHVKFKSRKQNPETVNGHCCYIKLTSVVKPLA